MNILHVIPSLDERWGGPPRGLANLVRMQAKRGHRVAVLPCEWPYGSQTLYPGQVGNLMVYSSPTKSRLFWYDHKLKRLMRRVARGRDILHIHGSWRYHLLGAASVARQYGIPYIVRPAGNMGHVSLIKRRRIKAAYFFLFEQSVYNRAAAIQCCSDKELRELEEVVHVRARKFIVPQPIESELPHTLPDHDQLQKKCPHLRSDNRVILSLGRIATVKRPDVLLEAFIPLSRDFHDWHLILAGPHENQELLSRLEQRIRDAGLTKRVSLPGLVTGELKAACFARAQVFAQPSLHENFGMSVAEALLLGIPCVVSNGVALADDIEESAAGLVCDSSLSSLEDALRTMLNDEPRRHACSLASRQIALRFNPARVAEQLDREYCACLN